VDSRALGKGAATALLARSEDLARANGSASVRIDTHPGNAPMHSLLAKAGYTQCGIIYIAHAEEGTPERIAYERLV
uniref:GNAT family N-acetyltransferase n=1 Tax=Eggerthella sinensis TaxID=242230 RepID=UPI0022DEC11A